MICLSCHGPNDLTLGYVSIESSLTIGQLELIILFYLYKCNRIENVIINTFSPIVCGNAFYRSEVKVTTTLFNGAKMTVYSRAAF